jgi:hypothetical protein
MDRFSAIFALQIFGAMMFFAIIASTSFGV